MIHEFRPDVAHVRNIYHHLSPSILWELKSQGIPVLYHLNDFKLICPSYNMVSHGSPCEKCHGGRFWKVVSEQCYDGPSSSAWLLATEAYVHKWLGTYERCVDRFLAPSQFVKEKLAENGWDPSRIDVLQHFQFLLEEVPPNFSPNAPVLYFGRLSAEKGVADLVRAMDQLPEIPLIVAGDGPQRAELDGIVRDLRLQNVTFIGHRDRASLEKLIGSARFTVMPSRAYETMGKSILESFASARAVIASDLGSRRELVAEGKTGLLFRPGDVNHLVQLISQLHRAPDIAIRMGNEAREYVRKYHSRDHHYFQLSKIYKELSRQNRSSSREREGMRIAFIGGRGVASKYSGIETYYEEASKELIRQGHNVTLYCRSYFTSARATPKGIRLVRLPTIRTKHLETFVHTFLSTIHALFGNCDIVHYHALGPALFSFLPRLAGKKTIVTIQGLDWQRKKWGWLASRVLRLGETAAVRFPNATIVVSQALQQRYKSQATGKINYIPNGTIIRAPTTSARLKDWGLASGEYILYLGRLSPEKNCHLLIEAYEKLDPPVKLVMAGGTNYSEPYADKLRKHATDKIKLLDWISGPDLDELLVNALLFVLPSDLEGLSLALLDAMGAGVCALASDIPENRELLDGAGYTFRRGDADDLARMMKLLIGDSGLRRAAAEKAQEKIRGSYLWPDTAKRVEKLYSKVMTNSEYRSA